MYRQHGYLDRIGDGANDAPAMVRTSLGLAMGATGSNATIVTTSPALMSDDLSKLPWVVNQLRRTFSTFRQNISFSLTVKVLFVDLNFSGFASLWSAIGGDVRASLLVIENSLRMLES